MKELLNEFEKDYNVLNFTEIQEKYFIKLLDALHKEDIALVYYEPKNQSNYRADISYTQYWIKAADIIMNEKEKIYNSNILIVNLITDSFYNFNNFLKEDEKKFLNNL